MENKTCLINQAAGLGDILLCQKIAAHVIELGYKVVWPVVDQYNYISEYIQNSNITFCSINDNFIGKEIYEKNGVDFIQTDNFLYLPINNADRILPSKSMLYAKYDYCQLSPDNWQNYFEITRNSDREKKLIEYFNIAPGEKYNVINKTFATPPDTITNTSIHPKNNYRNINMEILGWDRIFDWMGILEKAEEIHTVDTSLTLIMTKINVKNVHIYERTNGINANYDQPNPDYIHKALFCNDWKYYTSLTKNGFGY
jgi:hypothetical protein